MAAEGPLQVVVQGLEGEPLKNAELALSLPSGLIKDDRVDDLLLDLFQQEAPGKVQEALQPFGFYHSRVQLFSEKNREGPIRLIVKVDPGDPLRITSFHLEIQGTEEAERILREPVESFPLKVGDILRHDLYEKGKADIKAKALGAGFLEADFSIHTIRLSPAENTAEVVLVLHSGPRFYFGETFFDQGSGYPESFLRRYIAFQPGEVYSEEKLAKTRWNFLESDRFLEVSVEAPKEGIKDSRVPVRITLKPSKPKRFRMGVGYETDKGAGGVIRYQDLNFYRQGQEVNGELQVSERLQGLVVNYVLPGLGNQDSKTNFNLGLKREITDTYDSRSIFFKPEYSHDLGYGRLGSFYLNLLQDHFSIGNQDSISTLVMPGIRFWERRYDDLVKPSRGYRFFLEGRGGSAWSSSNTTFLQFLGKGDALIPLPQGFSVLLRLEAGTTIQEGSFENLPPSVRFFAGGDNSVRGYAYQSLGPKDASGKVVGGKNLLVTSLEIEKTITPYAGLAAFYDLGNAFDGFIRMDLKQGIGLGIRLYTPVGPLKLDLAYQLGEKDPQFRLHFSVGFGL